MQRIVPNIWFDHNAGEAAEFYAAIFPRGRVESIQYYPTDGLLDFQADMADRILLVKLELAGYRLVAVNAGAVFPLSPSMSFNLNFDQSLDPRAGEHLEEMWAALSDGGQVMMPLQKHRFRPRYGWVNDRFGVSWQLMLTSSAGEPRSFIVPSLMFAHTVLGRAAEAIEFYTRLFAGRTGTMMRHPPDAGLVAGDVLFADFQLFDQWFAAMDVAGYDFTFGPGISLVLSCLNQAEIDHYWNRLSTVPEAEQSGWCIDQFGINWQVVPKGISKMMTRPGAHTALMDMKKIEIAGLV